LSRKITEVFENLNKKVLKYLFIYLFAFTRLAVAARTAHTTFLVHGTASLGFSGTTGSTRATHVLLLGGGRFLGRHSEIYILKINYFLRVHLPVLRLRRVPFPHLGLLDIQREPER
jgi:hypothetical protein